MTAKKLFSTLFIITAITAGIWFNKAFKTVPALPAYENNLINEQSKPVKIADFKGQYVLVSYFQTWCGDCIKELPQIDILQTKLGRNKLKVLMVSDEGLEKIIRFKEKFCNTLEYYQSQKPLNEQSIRVFPTTYLLNKEGIVIMSRLNTFDWSSAEVISKCAD